MDVDSQTQAQAEISADNREEVLGVQLYDGSKSTVRHLPSSVPARFFSERARSLCVAGAQQIRIFLQLG